LLDVLVEGEDFDEALSERAEASSCARQSGRALDHLALRGRARRPRGL
jgi:hypothetical protein